jgi:hypothetical protein
MASVTQERLVSRTLPRRLVGALFTVAVVMLFVLSGGVLWELGINYDGLTGSTAAKIHPGTYLMIVTFALLVVARRNPAAFVATFVTRYPGALAFLIATVLLGAYIVLDNRHGIAVVVDTYMLAVLVSVIAGEVESRDLRRLEVLLHVFFAVNAGLGLLEYVIDHRFFPFRFDGALFEMERRSAALFGHPLENAVMTGIYVLTLVAGGGAAMPRLLRAPAVALQLAAMVPFGGRTALLVTGVLLALWMIRRAVDVMRGGRMSLIALAAVALVIPVLALAVGAMAVGGFFDLIGARFANDGGSAATRVEMLEIFNQLTLRDIIVGGDYDMLESIRRGRGLEWGVENPVVRLLLYQGAAFTLFLIVGFVLFMLEIGRRLRPGSAMAFTFFVIVINSYESIANKSILLAQFVVLILVMFRREPEPMRMPQPQAAAAVAWA